MSKPKKKRKLSPVDEKLWRAYIKLLEFDPLAEVDEPTDADLRSNDPKLRYLEDN